MKRVKGGAGAGASHEEVMQALRRRCGEGNPGVGGTATTAHQLIAPHPSASAVASTSAVPIAPATDKPKARRASPSASSTSAVGSTRTKASPKTVVPRRSVAAAAASLRQVPQAEVKVVAAVQPTVAPMPAAVVTAPAFVPAAHRPTNSLQMLLNASSVVAAEHNSS